MAEQAQDPQDAQFDDSPEGWARRWQFEFDSARKTLKKWHEQGEKIVKRFLDERDSNAKNATRWNFFTANIQTQKALLYGKTPQVSVERRFSDSKDDVARVSGEMMERLLNTDIERDGDTYALTLEHCLSDRLLPGLGVARVRLELDTETKPGKQPIIHKGVEAAPAVPATEQVKAGSEQAPIDYVPWKDYAWSAEARTEHEVRWRGFRAAMSREKLVQRFGEIGKLVPLNSKRPKGSDPEKEDPWGRADVWEIWDKEHLKVFWWVEGYSKILDSKDDPLGLDNFWPCPRPMLANPTTSSLLPRPDFVLAQDIYDEIDYVSTRITAIERTIKVAGVYDKTASDSIGRILKEGFDNDLIPVENWGAFSEKGGVKGAIDWLPLEQVVGALDKLRDYRTELVNALYQITGMSDIMRGEASDSGSTATEQSIKAKFASVRMQALQDEFARFASDLQRLKAEVISKHFQPATIVARSNAQFTEDAQDPGLILQAAQLIKDKFASYRVVVKPEAVSMTDFAALKAERGEFLAVLSQFITAAPAMLQLVPGALVPLLELLQWTVTGMKGSSTPEAILDRAIAMAQQAPPPQQGQQGPNPDQVKMQMNQQKAQLDMQKQQQKTQGDLLRIQAETQANAQQQQDQAKWNIYEQQAKENIKHGGVAQPSPIGPAAPGGVL